MKKMKMLMSAIVMVCLMVGVSNTLSAQTKKATDFIKKEKTVELDKDQRKAKIAATKQKIQQKKAKVTPKNFKNNAVELSSDKFPNRNFEFNKQVISPTIRQMADPNARSQNVTQRIQQNRPIGN